VVKHPCASKRETEGDRGRQTEGSASWETESPRTLYYARPKEAQLPSAAARELQLDQANVSTLLLLQPSLM